MKRVLFVVLVLVVALIPVFVAQWDGSTNPITKVEVLEEGVYKYKGETKGNVVFDHNMHVELMDDDCTSCHDGEPVKIEVGDMSSGHGFCSNCHDQTEDMDSCTFCHSK